MSMTDLCRRRRVKLIIEHPQCCLINFPHITNVQKSNANLKITNKQVILQKIIIFSQLAAIQIVRYKSRLKQENQFTFPLSRVFSTRARYQYPSRPFTAHCLYINISLGSRVLFLASMWVLSENSCFINNTLSLLNELDQETRKPGD